MISAPLVAVESITGSTSRAVRKSPPGWPSVSGNHIETYDLGSVVVRLVLAIRVVPQSGSGPNRHRTPRVVCLLPGIGGLRTARHPAPTELDGVNTSAPARRTIHVGIGGAGGVVRDVPLDVGTRDRRSRIGEVDRKEHRYVERSDVVVLIVRLADVNGRWEAGVDALDTLHEAVDEVGPLGGGGRFGVVPLWIEDDIGGQVGRIGGVDCLGSDSSTLIARVVISIAG